MLIAGSRLGPYEIIAPLGSGGMGVVFAARDTRLPRQVAIKVLPADRVADAHARQRFEREAAAVARLSHPHICTLHDIGVEDGRVYLVMEHLAGETLAGRIARAGRSGLPLREVLAIGADVAEALACAHRLQIVHRDVKPANVMLTNAGTKLLDFGVAALERDEPTVTATTPTLTAPGALVGTPSYMAPEQLDGHADAQSDLFALGAVLYEMLTGCRAFPGATTSAVIAALTSGEPAPIATHRPGVPAAVERLVHRCLHRDPARRWQSAADLADELRWTLESVDHPAAPPAATPRQWRFGALAAASLAGVLGAALWFGFGGRSVAPRDVEAYIDDLALPERTVLWGGQIALSPTGRHVAVVTQPQTPGGAADPRIWIQRLGSDQGWQLIAGAGSEIVRYPFWSPDGGSLAFFSAGKLMRMSLATLTAVPLADAPDGRGGAWLDGGTIVFAPDPTSDLLAVPAAGGAARVLVQKRDGDLALKFPVAAGPGRVMFLAQAVDAARNEVRSAAVDGAATLVVATTNGATFDQGVLYYVRDGQVIGQRLEGGVPSGEITDVPGRVAIDRLANANGRPFSAAGGAVALETVQPAVRQLIWVDRGGVPQGRLGDAAPYDPGMALSIDGSRLLVARVNERASTDVWLTDVATGATRAVTSERNAGAPLWAPDHRRFMFRAAGGAGGNPTVYERAVDGGPARRLLDAFVSARPGGWIDQGRRFIWWGQDPASKGVIFLTEGPGPGTALERFGQSVDGVRASPDGRLVAYASGETGIQEIYLRDPAAPIQPSVRVSRGGGVSPRWRADGRELYFLAGGALHAAIVGTSGTGAPTAGPPRRLFAFEGDYEPHPQGTRFLTQQTVTPEHQAVRILHHWTRLR